MWVDLGGDSLSLADTCAIVPDPSRHARHWACTATRAQGYPLRHPRPLLRPGRVPQWITREARPGSFVHRYVPWSSGRRFGIIERRDRLRTYKRPCWAVSLRARARIITAQRDSIHDSVLRCHVTWS